MTERVLGEKGSKKRKRFLLLPALATAALALFWISGAQAVHALGVFELDLAPNGANTTNDPAVAGDDWENVCHQIVGTDCGTSTNTSGATAVAWSSDQFAGTSDPFTVNGNATIFTGGGSKDPQDTSAWAWKDGAGGLPDKDNLQHAFAARYTATSADCPGAETTCDVIYYGSDRFDNSGDAQQGFWFLQNATSTVYDNDSNPATPPVSCPQKIGGGTGFCDPDTGAAVSHENNDVLVISDFSNGGTTSTITIYTWQNGVLQLEAGGPNSSAECGSPTDDAFCGIVNLTDGTPADWPFLDKSGNNGSYLAGELFEAGFDLTNLGLGGTCFSSVVSETRSSTSTTATLKDFVVASFGACSSEISTAQNWLPNDSATLTVVAPNNTWSGAVQFTLFSGDNCGATSGSKVYPANAAFQSVNVGQTNGVPATVTASTTNNGQSPAGFLLTNTGTQGSDFSWKVHFEPSATSLGQGVPRADACEKTTGITITN